MIANRIAKRLAQEVIPPEGEQEERDSTARYDRERKIKGLIKRAFQQCGIPTAKVYYDEEDGREGSVDVEEITGKQMSCLMVSGLSGDFKVEALSGNLDVSFIVDPALDNAV